MGSPTDCATKEPTTVGGIEATIVPGEVEAITVGLAPQTAGQGLPIVGQATEATTADQAQLTAGQAAAEITAVAAGGTTFAM